jgi:hypothetical protein
MNTDNCSTYLIDAFSQGKKRNFKRNKKKRRNFSWEVEKTVTKLRIQKLGNHKEKKKKQE